MEGRGEQGRLDRYPRAWSGSKSHQSLIRTDDMWEVISCNNMKLVFRFDTALRLITTLPDNAHGRSFSILQNGPCLAVPSFSNALTSHPSCPLRLRQSQL